MTHRIVLLHLFTYLYDTRKKQFCVSLIKHKFRTREETRSKIFEYVEMFYNRKGAQSTLDYMSPFEYERQKVNNDETFCH